MKAEYPVPRSEISDVQVPPNTQEQHLHMMEDILTDTVDKFCYYRKQGCVDVNEWKAVGTREGLVVHKEQERGVCDLGSSMQVALNSVQGASRKPRPTDYESLLMVGEIDGTIADVLEGIRSASDEELAMVDLFLHGAVADCAILQEVESQGRCLNVAYKWFVRKAPFNSNVIRHRDNVYLESYGTTETPQGEEIAYMIMHSVEVPNFPSFEGRNTLRAMQSLRLIFHQTSPTKLELFCVGALDIAGIMVGALATTFEVETLLGLSRLAKCGRYKRLTRMVMKRRQDMFFGEDKPESRSWMCNRCGKKAVTRFFLSGCEVCGIECCSKCRTTHEIYEHVAIIGELKKVSVCNGCALKASTRAEPKYRRCRQYRFDSADTDRLTRPSYESFGPLSESQFRPTFMVPVAYDDRISEVTLLAEQNEIESVDCMEEPTVKESSTVPDQNDLYGMLLALNKKAESSYRMAQENARYMMSERHRSETV